MSTKLSKHLIGSIAAVMALSACSSEDAVINEAKAQKEITFNVTTNRASRAAAYYNAASDVKRFKVSAWATQGTSDQTIGSPRAYFQSEGLTLKGEGNDAKWSWDDSFVRYWPNNGETLDFYAWVDNKSNAEVEASEGVDAVEANVSKGYAFEFAARDNRATLLNIQQENAADMVDLLYANEFNNAQTVNAATGSVATSDKVKLDMNHAFAQVGVAVKVVNPKIKVEVSEVKLVNLNAKGDFKFATEKNSTDDNKKAQWTPNTTEAKVSPIATISPAKAITYAATDNNGENLTAPGNTFMVIPSTYTAAEGGTNINNDVVAAGTCIALKCKVWNIENTTTGYVNDDMLIYGKSGDTGYKYLYIPVALTSEMGKNYTYTISFGTGNAGFNGEGADALVKVDWAVEKVDDWTNVPSTGENGESLPDLEN